jgi:hypothetical protein
MGSSLSAEANLLWEYATAMRDPPVATTAGH